MNIQIQQYYNKEYYLCINSKIFFDIEVAEYLDMSYEEYKNILFKHGAYLHIGGSISFTDIDMVKQAVEELEPHLILIQLTE
jgi:hypothetical protein